MIYILVACMIFIVVSDFFHFIDNREIIDEIERSREYLRMIVDELEDVIEPMLDEIIESKKENKR